MLLCFCWQHLGNLWHCYYEDSATAADGVKKLYEEQLANLEERACPSEQLIYSYYESIAYNKVKRRVSSARQCSTILIIVITYFAHLHFDYIAYRRFQVRSKQTVSFQTTVSLNSFISYYCQLFRHRLLTPPTALTSRHLSYSLDLFCGRFLCLRYQ